MITTDFSGTYDYEREEAENSAQELLGIKGDYSKEEFDALIMREVLHWKKCLDSEESFDCFLGHFWNAMNGVQS
jgi:hypothetical protein